MTKNTSIAKKEEVLDLQTLMSAKVDAGLQAKIQEESAGYSDGMGSDDLEIPRLKIVQALTAEIVKTNTKHIAGLEQGDIINTLTKEIVKGGEPLLFVPSIRKISYIEFKDKKLVNHYGQDSTVYDSLVPDDKGRRKTPQGGEVDRVQENYVYVIDLKNKTCSPALFPIKAYKMKAFNMIVRTTKVPEYATIFALRTKPESKDGNDWFGFEITKVNSLMALGDFGEEIYDSAKSFNESFNDANIKVDYDDEDVKGDDRV